MSAFWHCYGQYNKGNQKNLLYLTFSYTKEKMDLEIARVSREMYKAFNGLNEGFAEVGQ